MLLVELTRKHSGGANQSWAFPVGSPRKYRVSGGKDEEAQDPLRLSPLLRAPSGQVLEAVRKLGLEGVVGKRIDSTYEPGERSGAWIKHLANREQEFVIGGYIPGAHGFDALLVGVYENKQLIFVAKVKNGFVPRLRDEILPALKRLKAAHCPFTNLPETKATRWGESLRAVPRAAPCRKHRVEPAGAS
jgi:ATP-dependent DNA ligase